MSSYYHLYSISNDISSNCCSLPTEIWSIIFSFWAEPYHIFDSSVDPGSPFPSNSRSWTSSVEDATRYAERVRARSAIRRVCRKWNALEEPALRYERVTISRQDSLVSFVEALLRSLSATEIVSSSLPLGALKSRHAGMLVRRITVQIHRHDIYPSLHDFTTAFFLLKSLEILVVNAEANLSMGVLLVSSILRCSLPLNTSRGISAFLALMRRISRFSKNLRSCQSCAFAPDPFIPLLRVRSDKLHRLEIARNTDDSGFNWLPTAHLPALRELILKYPLQHPINFHTVIWLAMLPTLSQLSSLDIRCIEFRAIDIVELLGQCQRLVDLTIHYQVVGYLRGRELDRPLLSRLGLFLGLDETDRLTCWEKEDLMDAMDDCVAFLTGTNTALRCVCLVDFDRNHFRDQYWTHAQAYQWARWIEAFTEVDIAFEHGSCVPVQAPAAFIDLNDSDPRVGLSPDESVDDGENAYED